MSEAPAVSVSVPVRERAAATSDPASVDPCRLDVYGVALEFHSRVSRLADRRGQAHLRDQLARASLSIALNVAEGAGRVAPADKGRFYAIARGSACECWAILDVIERAEGLPLRRSRRPIAARPYRPDAHSARRPHACGRRMTPA